MPDPGDGDAWRIAVLGAGSWGTALASLAARNGHDVVLYGRDPTALAQMAESRENARYLPGFALPPSLRFSACLSTACADADLLLAAVPSANFGQLARDVAAASPNVHRFAWATKGLEPGSGRFLHEVAQDIFGPTTALCVVTGPSFAREVVAGLPTAVTVHANPPEFAQQVADILHRPTFRAYTGEDIIGAELGGAMKNVLAVAAGVADGMELGLNARAGMITRGLHEMMRLNAALGGRAETLMGLAGLGDLVLTCTGDLSRNRRLGLALGRGVSLADAVAEIGQAVESIEAADEIMRLAERHNVELPISGLVRAVLHGEVTPGDALRKLLSRDQKPEYPQIWFA